MIRYALVCSAGHDFEGWFRNAEDYDRQAAAAHLSCPLCGDAQVEKALMAPAVSARSSASVAEGAAKESGSPPAAAETAMMAMPDPRQAQVLDMMRKLRRYVTETAENVGSNFAKEARRIHHGEAERRGIYGSASSEDARELVEEGIDLLPLPVLPEDKN